MNPIPFRALLLNIAALLSVFFAAAQTPDANGIVYVKPTATGTGDGSSWANATANLYGAVNASGVSKVYAAIGHYYYENVGTVNLKNGVEIYGGFDPVNDQTDWTTRFLPNKQTGTLTSGGNVMTPFSGSVLDGTNGDGSTQIRLVYSSSGIDNSAVLDGFTVAGGFLFTGSSQGGGIYNYFASPTLRNLLITNNLGLGGGGMYNQSSSPVVTDVIISHNAVSPTLSGTLGLGGGVRNTGNSSPVFTNVLFVGNTSYDLNTGGAVHHSGTGTATFINCTFHNNLTDVNVSAIIPNAVLVDATTTGTVAFINSIVYGSVIGNYTAQNSMIEGNTDFSNGNIDITGHSAGDVFLSPTSSYGNWYTDIGNYALAYTAPAVNAGNNALFPNLNANTTDIAGNPRVNSIASLIDMGAYESAYTPVAPTNGIVYVRPSAVGNGDGSSWEDAVGDLHNAIATAGVSKIFVAVGNYPVGSHSFVMKNNLEIYGGFDPDNNIRTLNDARIYPSLTTEGAALDGQNALPVIFNEFTAFNPLDNTALLDGFTIKNGNYNLLNTPALPTGGGIRNVYASPVFNHVVIKNNTTNLTGGGVFNQYGDPVFMNTILTGNTDHDGRPGIYNLYPSSLTCINFLAFGNTSSQGNREIWVAGGVTTTFINATIIGTNANDIQLYTEGASIINSVIPKGIYNSTVSVLKNSLIPGAIAGADNTNIDATGMELTDIFTDPANNDYTLKSNSPAVNMGDNSLFPNLDANTRDIAGDTRLFGPDIDMGAYEYQGADALPVIFGSLSAVMKNGQLLVNWTTESETNNDHFLIQVSGDGVNFKTIQTIQSKATDGNSSMALEYSSAISLTGLSLGAGFLLLGAMAGRRRRYAFALAAVVCCALAFSCSRKDLFKSIDSGKLLVRIVQVDKDGKESASKAVQVINQ